ncbi:MAG TPA: hypothetical protein DIT04_09205 [Dysgonomonas sp.]|nr:hypothetical protein [Dysgonomonas sp.]
MILNNKLKYKIIVSFLICFHVFSLNVQSQNNLLADMQGLTYEEGIIFEIEGYTIHIERNNISLNKKGIEKVKKKYDIKNVISEYRDTRWKWENYVIEAEKTDKKVPGLTTYQLSYLIPETDNITTVVYFESPNRKDTLIEQAFMNAFFTRQINRYVTDSWNAEEMDFAGRKIPLGNICAWISPYNVHCPSFGQISWSVFRTKEDAEINNYAMYLTNKYSDMHNVVSEEERVPVIFEGYPVNAKRVTYKLKRSKILLGGRNLQAVYYVVQKVRGKYMSCILSHYIEDKENYQLAPLLQEVMKLDN